MGLPLAQSNSRMSDSYRYHASCCHERMIHAPNSSGVLVQQPCSNPRQDGAEHSRNAKTFDKSELRISQPLPVDIQERTRIRRRLSRRRPGVRIPSAPLKNVAVCR